jgi:hypothetical protein
MAGKFNQGIYFGSHVFVAKSFEYNAGPPRKIEYSHYFHDGTVLPGIYRKQPPPATPDATAAQGHPTNNG